MKRNVERLKFEKLREFQYNLIKDNSLGNLYKKKVTFRQRLDKEFIRILEISRKSQIKFQFLKSRFCK